MYMEICLKDYKISIFKMNGKIVEVRDKDANINDMVQIVNDIKQLENKLVLVPEEHIAETKPRLKPEHRPKIGIYIKRRDQEGDLGICGKVLKKQQFGSGRAKYDIYEEVIEGINAEFVSKDEFKTSEMKNFLWATYYSERKKGMMNNIVMAHIHYMMEINLIKKLKKGYYAYIRHKPSQDNAALKAFKNQERELRRHH